MMLLVICIFLVILVVGGTLWAAHNQAAQDRRATLFAMIAPEKNDDIGKGSKDARASHARAREKRLKNLKTETESKSKNTMAMKIAQAGLQIGVAKFYILSCGAGLLVAGMIAIILSSPMALMLAFITGCFGLPRMVLSMLAGKRRKAFLADLAEALEAMARLMRSGLPVGEAIAMCAREFGGPLGEEMRRVYDAQKIGIPLPDAVREAAQRMPLAEMRMMATAFSIQQQTGSSLSEVLESLAGMIRARQRLRRKVVALSSEAKASSAIIGALPVFVALSLKLVNPDYIALLYETPMGKLLLGVAIGMMGTGILVMRQMINFRI